ncbi:MAG: threonine synthase [Planctomycetaceae bacterium]|nr:threonine synthase [Planctomycetaceae bacterium]
MSVTETCFVSHLEGAIDGARLEPQRIHTLHEGRPIWVRYDLDSIRHAVTKNDLVGRPPNIWRYKELLPVFDMSKLVSFGEGMSPLLNSPRLGTSLGIEDLWIKDESQLPTGSFKSRGMAMAVTMANHFGITSVALPTAGNAGGAAAAYAARAGMTCHVFMPEDTPMINQYEAMAYGANAYRVNGLINDCGRIVNEGKEIKGWFDLSTLKEPYRIEGKKTMGLELAEQFDWQLPDAIFYPTGGGTGLIGMWKAFQELKTLGWLESDKLPRMYSVQSSGCAPIVEAFDNDEKHATPYSNAHSIASGIRVPAAVGDFMILDAVRQSGGKAIRVEESRIGEWMRLGMSREGISICPETGACIGAVEACLENGTVSETDRVVIYNTGAAQKYAEALACEMPSIDKDLPIDWSSI